MSMRLLGIIPARGGSKGIPNKNIKELDGRPLLSFTVDTARESEIFDDVILSTDSPRIAAVGRSLGVEVPFIRPKELARDDTATLPVIRHALSYAIRQGRTPDHVCILQPTAPFRTIEELMAGYSLIKETGCDSVVSVELMPQHYAPDFVMKITEGQLHPFLDDGKLVTRRQDVTPGYLRSGCFYFTRAKVILEDNSIYGKDCRPIVVTSDRKINLDSMEDWAEAERITAKKDVT